MIQLACGGCGGVVETVIAGGGLAMLASIPFKPWLWVRALFTRAESEPETQA